MPNAARAYRWISQQKVGRRKVFLKSRNIVGEFENRNTVEIFSTTRLKYPHWLLRMSAACLDRKAVSVYQGSGFPGGYLTEVLLLETIDRIMFRKKRGCCQKPQHPAGQQYSFHLLKKFAKLQSRE